MKNNGNDTNSLIVCGGCNAKIGAGDLHNLLQGLPRNFSPHMLIGFEHSDDAAVIQLTDEIALIQTLDFFPSPVSNPYLFGQIAATNALSDIYAMGGTPLCALNIVAFPESDNYEILKTILHGGAEKVQESGAILAGGHSIHDARPKYGLSVTGTAHPKKIWANNNTHIGDKLFLTKPLGVGLVTAAYSVGEIDKLFFDEACKSMCTLNKYAADFFRNFNIHACTDVTGFGLIGHLNEMLNEKNTAVLKAKNIPIMNGAKKAAEEFLLTAGGQRNRTNAGKSVLFKLNDFALEEILFDPQTSGGLLFSVSEAEAHKIYKEKNKTNIPFWEIGTITEKQQANIIIE